MINFDDVTKENINEHNPIWLQIPNHPYTVLIVGGSRYGKSISLSNLKSQQSDVYKICVYVKDPSEAKC